MGQVIRGHFQNRIINNLSPIDLTKAIWGNQAESMRKAVGNSYEDRLEARIKLAEWRAEGYQDSNDWDSAALEISYRDGLKYALKLYKEWSL